MSFVHVHPDDQSWGHFYATGGDGGKIHYIRQGKGQPVLLLHGWPGFWYDWRRVIPELAKYADVIAPDFRGFGDSDKPDRPAAETYTPQTFTEDMVALLDQLGIEKTIVVAHDIGATVAQYMARTIPDRIDSLVLLNPPYPGIGARRFEPSAQKECWYQHLHNLPWSDQMIGYNRDTVRLYLSHFYDHWVGRKEAILPDELNAIIDKYSRPGAIRSSIAYYRARSSMRGKEAESSPQSIIIQQPTIVLWGEADPVIPSVWSDRLHEYFSDLTLHLLPGVGHFVPIESPLEVIEAVRNMMSRTN